ncbi:MAG: FtsX-like permease family protein [Bacteroidota bacterium]
MNTNQKIASVFLSSRMRQLLVAVLSVTFGISMYVFMNSFMAGVNNFQTEISFTSMSHIKVFNELESKVENILTEPEGADKVLMINNARNIRYTEGIRNTVELKNEILELKDVTAVTTQLNQNVFIRNGVSQRSASLSGIESLNENQIFKTSEYLVEGDLFELDKRSNGIILGIGLAKNIGVAFGDNINIITSEGVSKIFKVVGIIETGSIGADRSRALVSMRSAQQLFSKNTSYGTEILVNVKDYQEAQSVAAEIKNLTDYKVEAWQEGNSQLDSSNGLRDIMAIAVSLTILIVAGFGIYNIMTMTVNEKIKEIAILKAMGFNGKDVIEIFLTQSVVIGFIGGITGLVLGNIIVKIVDRVPFEVASMATLPVEYRASDYLLAFCFGLIISFLAGYLPARNASKVDPVAILRG